MAQTEQASVHINLDIAESERKVRELEKSLKQLREAKKYATSADDRNKFNEQIKETKASVDALKADLRGKVDLVIDGKAAGASLANMEKAARQLRNTLRNELIPGTKEYNETLKKYLALSKQVASESSKLVNKPSFFSKLKAEAGALGVAALGFLGIQQLLSGFTNSIAKTAELSDAFANVAKTTGLSTSEVKNLNEQLALINTRTSRIELLKLASDAGKLGIEGTANIKKFVQEADMIKVALGEDLGEGAVTDIAKIAELFGVGMLNIASSINTIGQSSAATEQYQVDFLGRMSGIAVQSKITASEIQGYGAALELSKVQSETASTALGQFFIDFQRDTEKFGKAAGFAKGELSKLIADKGVNAGFIQFLKNFKAANPEQQKFLDGLKNMGIDGARGAQTFLALANNIGKVEQQQALANKSLKEGTSIMNEFNTRNNTFAAQLERVQKTLYAFVSNNSLTDKFAKLVGYIDDLTSPKLSEAIELERDSLFSLQLQLNDTNTTSARRKEIILQLQKEYPAFLGNIDAEKVSNLELNTAIDKINNSLISKIVLQKKEEELLKSATKAADGRLKMEEQNLKMTQLLQKLQKNNPEVKAVLGISAYTNLSNAYDKLQKTKGYLSRELNNDLFDAEIIMRAYRETVHQTKDAKIATDELTKSKQAYIDQLNKAKVAETTTVTGATVTGNGTKTDEEIATEKKIADADAAKAKQLADQTIDLLRKLRDLRIELMEQGSEKELAILEARYQDERAQIESLKVDAKVKADYFLELDKKYAKESEAICQAESDAKIAIDKKEKDDLTKAYEDFFKDNKQAIENVIGTFAGSVKSSSKDAADTFKKEFKNAVDVVSAYLEGLNQGIGGIFQIRSNKEQAAFNHEQLLSNKRKKALDNELKHKRISQEQYDAAMQAEEEAVTKASQQKQIEDFNANQKAARIQAIISTALSVARALAQPPGVPFTIPLGALAAALGGVQIAAINSTPPPEFEQGTYLTPDKLHVIQGPSHKQGGIDLVNTQTGQTIGNMEGDEGLYVLSKRTTPQTKAILEHGLATARTGIPHFNLNNSMSGFTTANTTLAANAIQQYSGGGFISKALTGIKDFGSKISGHSDAEQLALLKSIDERLSIIQSFTPDPFAGYRDFEKVRDRVESVRNTSRT